nr:MAG TPA: hypothetical protein [Caudoviricetes sp.]
MIAIASVISTLTSGSVSPPIYNLIILSTNCQ